MANYNKELINEKGLINNDDTKKYDKLIKNYKYLLEYYISTKVDLSKYEKIIKSSDLGISINPKYKSLNEYFNFDYIFLINNLFIEKLSLEDIDKLINLNKDDITSEILNIIEKTYKEVILDNYYDNCYHDEPYKVCYGDAILSNFVDNNALVFKIYYGKNSINLDGDEFLKLHEKQLSFLKDLIDIIKKDVKEKLNINCEILLEKDIYNN